MYDISINNRKVIRDEIEVWIPRHRGDETNIDYVFDARLKANNEHDTDEFYRLDAIYKDLISKEE